jgi:hypothetical protein
VQQGSQRCLRAAKNKRLRHNEKKKITGNRSFSIFSSQPPALIPFPFGVLPTPPFHLLSFSFVLFFLPIGYVMVYGNQNPFINIW